MRLLVQSAEHPAKEAAFSSKNWIKNLSESLKQQSNLLEENNNFAEMKNYDVGNEAYIDKIAIECLRDSGYSYLSAINFLTRLKKNKQDEEYKGFWRAGIGYDYRLDKLKELQSSLSQKGSPKNLVTNSKRFSRAATNWNLLP
ncbi:MAG: hypothetical protein M9962_11645 [Oligoflexia bacterium]|nr:hypothetical protein [Oligoflexia bacterium]